MALPERPQSPPDQQILAAAVAFARALRGQGMSASVDSELVFIRMLAELDVRERQEVYWAALATFVHNPDERPAFNDVFESFWEGQPLEGGEQGSEHGEADARMVGPQQQGGEALPQFRQEAKQKSQQGDGEKQKASREIPTGDEDGGSPEQRGILAAYSPAEQDADKQKLDYAEDELAAVRRLGEDIKRAAPRRRSRRLRPARGGDRLDIRRTVRNSLETDGEALRLAYTAQRLRPRRLLFICDVSGSMERYSRTLLGSLKAIVGANNKAEAFVFATKLTRLTKSLHGHDLERGLEKARAAVPDWSGGTRIGQALCDFNHSFGRRGFARGAIVIVVSDGWDRGDPEILAAEVRRIQLQAWRLVWINPRPMVVDQQPLAIGMRAAMPYIDDFVPGHDPRAIAGLATLIGGLDIVGLAAASSGVSELKPRPLPMNGGQQPLNKPPPANQWPAAANY